MALGWKRNDPDDMGALVRAAAAWGDVYVAAKWRAATLPDRALTDEAGALAATKRADRTDQQDATLTAYVDELAERAAAQAVAA